MAKRGHKEGKKRAKPETVRMPLIVNILQIFENLEITNLSLASWSESRVLLALSSSITFPA